MKTLMFAIAVILLVGCGDLANREIKKVNDAELVFAENRSTYMHAMQDRSETVMYFIFTSRRNPSTARQLEHMVYHIKIIKDLRNPDGPIKTYKQSYLSCVETIDKILESPYIDGVNIVFPILPGKIITAVDPNLYAKSTGCGTVETWDEISKLIKYAGESEILIETF